MPSEQSAQRCWLCVSVCPYWVVLHHSWSEAPGAEAKALASPGPGAAGGLTALPWIRPAETRASCAGCVPGNPDQHRVCSEKTHFGCSRSLQSKPHAQSLIIQELRKIIVSIESLWSCDARDSIRQQHSTLCFAIASFPCASRLGLVQQQEAWLRLALRTWKALLVWVKKLNST